MSCAIAPCEIRFAWGVFLHIGPVLARIIMLVVLSGLSKSYSVRLYEKQFSYL